MSAHTATTDRPARVDSRDRVTDIGLGIVGLAAAVLTFTTLRDLAVACGITETIGWFPLSYLVPITVDAAGVVAARVWLRRIGGPDAVRFARGLAWACIGLSVAGNAGQHGLAAYGISAPWWVVVIVSAVPPASLGAVVHLGHLIGRGPIETGQEMGVPAGTSGHANASTAVSAPAELPAAGGADAWADQGRHDIRTEAAPDPVRTVPAVPERAEPTDDEIREWLHGEARRTGEVPGRKPTRDRWGIGSSRADRLRAEAVPAGKPGLRRAS